MLITESMPEALGDQAQKVLIFIEQALRSSTTENESTKTEDREDAVDSDDEEEDQESQADGERLNQDPTDDLDAKDVTKLGLMETAIHLLLATLHCKHLGVSHISAYSLIEGSFSESNAGRGEFPHPCRHKLPCRGPHSTSIGDREDDGEKRSTPPLNSKGCGTAREQIGP